VSCAYRKEAARRSVRLSVRAGDVVSGYLASSST
jgi:hypothetical protein